MERPKRRSDRGARVDKTEEQSDGETSAIGKCEDNDPHIRLIGSSCEPMRLSLLQVFRLRAMARLPDAESHDGIGVVSREARPGPWPRRRRFLTSHTLLVGRPSPSRIWLAVHGLPLSASSCKGHGTKHWQAQQPQEGRLFCTGIAVATGHEAVM